MWFTGIGLEDGRRIEARHRAGRWRWRLVSPGAEGPLGVPLAQVFGASTDALAELIVRVRDVPPSLMTLAVIEPLGEALDDLSIDDAGIERWRDLLSDYRRRALALCRSCAALRDLLRLAAERITAPAPRCCTNALTRKRARPGIANEKSHSRCSSYSLRWESFMMSYTMECTSLCSMGGRLMRRTSPWTRIIGGRPEDR